MKIGVTLRGIRPLQLNRFLDDAKEAISEKTSKVLAGQRPPVWYEAKMRGYFEDEDGKIPFVPHDMLFNCIVDAGRFIKSGRRQLTTGQASQVPGLVVLAADRIPLLMRDPNDSEKFVPAIWNHERFLPQNSMGHWPPYGGQCSMSGT